MQGKAVTKARGLTTELGEAQRALGLYKDEEGKRPPTSMPPGLLQPGLNLDVSTFPKSHSHLLLLASFSSIFAMVCLVKFHAQVRREIANTRGQGKDPYPIVKCLTLKEELMAA